MPCPRIFVSSTYYDLKHVREIIREFIENLGYQPVLSEFSDIFYKPGDTVQNSCLGEISSCDIFVLIVGQRYGSMFPGDSLSITHREYIEAQNLSIPIYSFVDLDVLHDYEFYKKNTISSISYRVVKDPNIFGLIDDIKNASKDNALISFSSIADILQHLKKQWANLFKNYLKGKQLEINKHKPSTMVRDDFNEFKEKLKLLGIEGLTQENINKAASLKALITSLNGKINDLNTDYKISIGGKTTNIGKNAFKILDNKMRSIKTN
jgi:hypothetical protein